MKIVIYGSLNFIYEIKKLADEFKNIGLNV